jgi:hypothetical protein
MKQLTKNELEELSRLWDDLSGLSDGFGPPLTYDEMIEAGVDALLAGVFSSEGYVGREGLAEFRAILSYRARSPALQEILTRLAVMLGLSHEP